MAGPTSDKCTGDAGPMIPMFYVCKVGVDRELQKEKHDCQQKGTACWENMGKWLQIQHSERHQETLLQHSPRRSFSFSSETSSDNSILGVYKLNRTRVEAVESQYMCVWQHDKRLVCPPRGTVIFERLSNQPAFAVRYVQLWMLTKHENSVTFSEFCGTSGTFATRNSESWATSGAGAQPLSGSLSRPTTFPHLVTLGDTWSVNAPKLATSCNILQHLATHFTLKLLNQIRLCHVQPGKPGPVSFRNEGSWNSILCTTWAPTSWDAHTGGTTLWLKISYLSVTCTTAM